MRSKPRRLRCFSQWGSLEREKKEKEGRGYRWRRWEETPRNAEEGGEEGRKLVVVVVVICGILDRRIDGVGQEFDAVDFFGSVLHVYNNGRGEQVGSHPAEAVFYSAEIKG